MSEQAKPTVAEPTAAIAVYPTHELADQAVKTLQKSGFDMKKLSVIGKGYHTEEQPVGYYTLGEKMKVWGGVGATWGAIWGGFWGLLFGAGMFLIPGVGPILAAGPLVGVVVGALEGGIVVGGLGAIGAALVHLGVPKDQAIRYEQALKADQYVLIVHGTAEETQRAKAILDQAQATESALFSRPDAS
jgi:hypothetical protein